MHAGALIGILYLGFVAVIFSLMSIAQSTDDANELLELDAELPQPPIPHRRAGGPMIPRATSSIPNINIVRTLPIIGS